MQRVEEKVQEDLLDLCRVVFGRRQIIGRCKTDLDRAGERLLARQCYRMLDARVQISAANLGRSRAGVVEQLGQDVLDMQDLLLDILQNVPTRAVRWEVAADDFNHTGNSRQRVANFMGQASGQFAQGSQVLGTRHLRAVQPFNFLPAGDKLSYHVVKVPAELADFVLSNGKSDAH